MDKDIFNIKQQMLNRLSDALGVPMDSDTGADESESRASGDEQGEEPDNPQG